MFDEKDPGTGGESVRAASPAYRDVATSARDRHRDLTSTHHVDPLPFLIADAEPAVLGRTVLALAAMHEPDERGRCRVCSTRWWRWRSRGQVWCSTRRMLWATLADGHPAGAG